MTENSRAHENTDVDVEASWAGSRDRNATCSPQYEFRHAHTGLEGGQGQFMPVSIFDKGAGAVACTNTRSYNKWLDVALGVIIP